MNAYEKIRAALEQAYKERHEPCSVELRIDEALAALAELECDRAEELEAAYLRGYDRWQTEQRGAPVAAATQFVAGEVDDAMCDRIFESWARLLDKTDDYSELRQFIAAVRSELGPALGLVEIREPTPEECERICTAYERLLMRVETCGGRDAFDAVRAVMWPKEGL